MSLLNSRSHAGTATHRFLQRTVNAFDANAARITARLHTTYGLNAVPAPSITDALAVICDGDDVLCAQLMGGVINKEIEGEICDTIASTFARHRGDLSPTQAQISKQVGTRLAGDAYKLLSLADLIAITRTLSRDDAKALCEKRIASRRAAMRESVVTL